MSRRPREINIPDIAKEAGVSPSTVSRVINRRAGVGEETRKKISDLLERYGFKSNYPMMRTTRIAVIYPWLKLSEYFRKVMDGIYSYAKEYSIAINTLIAGFNTKESLLETVREQQCTGVIALLSEHYYKDLLAIIDSDLPVMLVDATAQDPRVGFIDNDSYSGSCEAAKCLLELGHTKIGYLTYSDMSLNQLQRYKGYVNTLKQFGLELNEDIVIKADVSKVLIESNESVFGTDNRGDIGYFAMKEFLTRGRRITALMAVDDSMALGAMAAIHEAGLKIPEDISVVGFDNYSETKYWYPPLSTVNHPLEEAGFMAIKEIHEALANLSCWNPPREILPTKLIIRKSACKL